MRRESLVQIDLSGVKVVDEEGLGQGVSGNNDWIVTLMSSPLSRGKVTTPVRLHSQLTI